MNQDTDEAGINLGDLYSAGVVTGPVPEPLSVVKTLGYKPIDNSRDADLIAAEAAFGAQVIAENMLIHMRILDETIRT